MNTETRMSPKLADLTQRLRQMVVAKPAGTPIGLEQELCQSLGCTRAMLRQACRVLEFQGVLAVRRGPRGGYFSAKPSAESVVEVAALYLEACETSLEEALRATITFTIEAVKLACQCPADHPAWQHMIDLRAELAAKFPEDMDAIEFASDEGRIDEVIFEMVNNNPLELLIKILNRISINEFGERLFVRQPARRVRFRNHRFELIDAILAGNSDGAVAAMGQLHACIIEWLPIGGSAKVSLAAAA